jgi:hypothetical protein
VAFHQHQWRHQHAFQQSRSHGCLPHWNRGRNWRPNWNQCRNQCHICFTCLVVIVRLILSIFLVTGTRLCSLLRRAFKVYNVKCLTCITCLRCHSCLTVITCITCYWPRRRSFLWGFFKIRNVNVLLVLSALHVTLIVLLVTGPRQCSFPRQSTKLNVLLTYLHNRSYTSYTFIDCLTCYWLQWMLFPSAIDNVKCLTCLTCLTSLTRLTRLTSLTRLTLLTSLTLLPLIVCLTCYWLWTTFLLATILQNPWRYCWENTFPPATIRRRSQKLSFQRNIDFSRQFCLHRRPNPASP